MTQGTGPAWRSRQERREMEAGAVEAGRVPEALRPEFPPGADLPPDGLTRRTMLGLMGASVALGGLAACRRPVEEIVPFVQAPEDFRPGLPRYYATTLPIGAHAYGVLVESHEGRPTKVEGNPRHPASRGAATAWMQAAILDLYDPDRLRGATRRAPGTGSGEAGAPVEAAWSDFAAWWQESGATAGADDGARLAVLAGAHCSPTLARVARQLRSRFPASRWVVHEPAGDEAVYEGLRRATGSARRPLADLGRARTVLALDADLFLTESEPIRNARGHATRRRAEGEEPARLYVVESTLSVTGGNADHRLRLPSRHIGAFAAAVAAELGVAAGELAADDLPAPARARAAVVARDLAASRGEAVVLAGRRQPPEVHALVHRINQSLGAVGPVLQLDEVPEGAAGAWGGADLADLARAIRAGEIDTLVVLGGNPAYTAPADLELPALLAAVPHVVALVHEANETAALAEWTLPLAHPFETWGD
ncbi:MAG TPA: molybdopterin oxidoreductase, partial [Thermoanaerobaculia bacterium]|nr:molybdopterin oxidoreductase [Thermoanaerobaculia bacterium]